MYYAKNLKKLIILIIAFSLETEAIQNKCIEALIAAEVLGIVRIILKKPIFNCKENENKSKNLLLMHQTHSNKVIFVNNKNKNKKVLNCDAMITKLKGFALGVVTADCVPILLFDNNNKIIGCIHAGWKGAFKGVVENTIKKFRKVNSNNKIYAGVGPCIGRKSYEVDLKFYKNFVNKSKKLYLFFKKE